MNVQWIVSRALLVFFLIMIATMAFAGIRVPNGQLIEEGDSAQKVIQCLGEPIYKSAPGSNVDAQVWFYKMPNGMTYKLLIKQGVVYSIDEGRE